MTNKRVIVGLSRELETANNILNTGKYTFNGVDYLFIEDRVMGYDNSRLEFHSDMIFNTNPTLSGRLDPEFDRRIIAGHWIPKCKQQARLRSVLKDYGDYTAIPTTECDLNISKMMEQHGPYFKTDEIRIKPNNMANGVGQKVISVDDPLVYRLRTRYLDDEFLKEHISPDVVTDDGVRVLLAQPNLKILDEWRLIYLGDDFLVARRANKDGKGTTHGLNDPYELIDDHDFECFKDNDIIKVDLYKICDKLKLTPGTSLDFALIDTLEGPKFVIIEYQPQFGTTELNWKLHDYCTEKFIENVLEPRALELGLI